MSASAGVCPVGQWISEDRNGQSGLSTCEVCPNMGAAVIIVAVRAAVTSAVCTSAAICLLERIVSSLFCIGRTAALNQDRPAIDHNGLTGAEAFLHQKQIGLCNVMSFADSPHRQTLAHAFIELLPFG
jgi:hypothetical protein